MGQTLENGVYLPSEGERNCYAGLKTNWEILDQKVADVTALQQAVAGVLHREIVESLPTTDIDPNTIYMILSGTSATENVYNEYMYVNNAWELIGTSATDLTNYYTKGDVDGLLLLKANDSDVVHTDEINSLGIGIIGAVKEVGGVDFNTLTTQGLYGTNASGSTNNPENSPCVVQVIKRLNSVIQIANVSSSAYKSRYIRYCADITAQPPVWQSWIKFAIDNEVVHKSGDETIEGNKTFSKYITSDGSRTGDEYSNNARTNLWLMGNRDTEDVSGVLFDTYRQNTAQGTGSHILGIGIKENSIRYETCRFAWGWDNNLNGYSFSIEPTLQGTNQAVRHNLGTSTKKWDTINGINPGALSLPDIDNRIDISSYITDLTGVDNEYTPTVNGWICVRSGNATKISILDSATNIGNQSVSSTATYLTVMAPCVANKKVYINIVCTSLSHAYFVPCQGNV